MEVLISMFVLAVGLLGVAALIPAGRHEIVEATKLETAAMVGRNAFRDLQIRGYMNPALNPLGLDPTLNPIGWRDDYRYGNPGDFGYRPDVLRTDGTRVPFAYKDPTTTAQANYDDPSYFTDQLRVVIDPLGLAAPAGPYSKSFPHGFAGPTPLPLRRIVPFQPSSDAFACFDTIFRSSFDLKTIPNPTNKDLPPLQYPPTGPPPVRRISDGNYSWLATIVSDPSRSAIDGDVNVAVAVFYKRDLSQPGAGEATATVKSFPVLPMTGGGEIVIENLPTDLSGKIKPLKPGQWIMLAGQKPIVNWNHYRWYRVLSAANYDTTLAEQSVTLAGQDWSIQTTAAIPVQVWIFDNIISVYEKSLTLEIE